MVLTPRKILENYQSENTSKHSTLKLLTSLIENSSEEEDRVESLEYIERIGIFNNNVFVLFEYLLVSDISPKVRKVAIRLMTKYYPNSALKPLKWAIQNETNYDCKISVIKSIAEMENNASKLILISEVKKIKKKKYIEKTKQINNKKFKNSLKKLFHERKIESLNNRELSEIIINFKTISLLLNKYHNVNFELAESLVVELNLSNGLEVRGTPWEFMNNINDLSEITGITNLKSLKSLDLSNNHVRDIKNLIKLYNLTHLILVNNNIKEIDSLDDIRNMVAQNLIYLDIRGNGIADKLNKNDFKGVKIRNKDNYYYSS